VTEKIKVLLANTDPEFVARVRAVSERVEPVTPEEVRRNPDLAAELEVVFGSLPQRDMLASARRLKWIQTQGAGVNGVLIPEVRERDVTITNAPIHAEAVTEHVFGMLLMVTRRLGEAWDQQKTARWKGYDFGANLDALPGKTLGLFGVGAIGGQSARVGKAFGMRTLGLRRTGEAHPDIDRMYSEEERLDFFHDADVILNTVPLTERTRRAISWNEFAAMKPGAILMNAGRGPTVHTEALMAALRDGKLGAALLDVTDPEPLPDDHPLWTMERVFITPHYGGSQPQYQERVAPIFLENLRRYVAGEPLMNVVDKKEGY